MTALHPDIIKQQVAQLRLQYGELESDDEAWLASLESETDLTELADKLIDRERECAAMAGGCETRIIEQETRKARFVDRGKRIRGVLLALLQAANVRKLERPEATISIRAGGEKLIIPDEAAVPEIWTRVKREIDKQRIKAAIAGGLEVNWAAIERSPESLAVRTK